MKFLSLFTFLGLLLILPGMSTNKQNTQDIKVSGYEDRVLLDKKYVSYWENTSNQQVDAQNIPYNKFKVLPGNVPNFGFIKHDVWFQFTMNNREIYDQTWILSLNNPNLDIAELYTELPSGKWIQLDQGDLVPYHKRTIKARKIAFSLNPLGMSRQTFYLRINNGGEQFHFSPELYTTKQFYLRESNEHYFLGIYIGLLVFVILFNGFMWILTREKISLHYSLYLITFLFLQLSLLGLGKQYLWPSDNYLVNHANPFFASASVFFLLHFSRIYLDLKNHLPRMDKFFAFLAIPLLLSALLALIPSEIPYTVSVLLVNAMTLVLNLLILPVAIRMIRKGYKPAVLFLVAFFLLVVSVFAFILKNFGILPSNFFTDYGFQFGSAAEVILFSIGIVIRFKNFRDEAIHRLEEINALKDQANEELERKVLERTEEIATQKLEIESKNQEIIASITYAKRIQEAILPPQEKVDHLLPNAALWYAPKDIVAGDFYWVQERSFHGKQSIFFAIGDCTGHGVPGAMMSLLCTNALDAALEELSSADPAQLLEIASQYIVENLGRNNADMNDGMDISIACLEPGTSSLSWSGANNPLWILRGDSLIEFTGTKRPAGRSYVNTPFEKHEILLEAEDRLFLFSDGILDQFGGPRLKKFKKEQLRSVILESAQGTVHEQLDHICSRFTDWKGDEEQVDDLALWIVAVG